MGHSHQVKSFSRRTRCQGTWQRRHNNLSKQVSSGVQSSSHQKRDGDSAVRDARVDSRIRYTPYTIVPYHQRDSSNKQDQTNVNIERDQKPPEGRMEGNQQDGTLGSWFKITIPFGIKYDKKWLLNLIQSQCSVPFIPVEFHYEKMQAHFFVENASTASALKDMCGKICDENNERIFIFVSPCCVPHAVQKEPKSKEVDQIKLTTNAQYDASQLALDIQRFHIDSDIAKNSNFRADMMTHDADMTSNLRKCVAASLHIHEENMPKPQMESAGEMDKGRGLEPEETYVDRNTLDTAFPDKSSNINSILELFPKLLRLDDQESPRPTLYATEACKKLLTCKGSFFGSVTMKSMLLQFLKQYYMIYDSRDRQSLLCAYHDEACFSLTIPSKLKNPDPRSLCEYFKESSNMRKLKDPYPWRQLMKHTKQDIVDTLSVLPKTQHDLSSFVVDMWFQTELMVCFSVNGVFKEVEGKSHGSVHAFTRTFIAMPTSNFSLCIVNDKLFVWDSSPQGIQRNFSIPKFKPSSSSIPNLSQEQQDMVRAFSAQSGMNLEWCQQFLQNNHWDYKRAAQVLALSKAKG